MEQEFVAGSTQRVSLTSRVQKSVETLRSVMQFRPIELDPVARRLGARRRHLRPPQDRATAPAAWRLRLHGRWRRRRDHPHREHRRLPPDRVPAARAARRQCRRPLHHAPRSPAADPARPRAHRVSRAASIPTASSRPRRARGARPPPVHALDAEHLLHRGGRGRRQRTTLVPGVRVARPRHGQGDDRARRPRRATRRSCSPSTPRCSAAASATCGTASRCRPSSGSTRSSTGRSIPDGPGSSSARIRSGSPTSSATTSATAPARSRSPTTSTPSSIPRSRGATSTGFAACGTARS